MIATALKRTVTHYAGIAKPEASWDDLVSLMEWDATPGSPIRYRHGQALVTAEFMQNAQDALSTVTRILDGAMPSLTG